MSNTLMTPSPTTPPVPHASACPNSCAEVGSAFAYSVSIKFGASKTLRLSSQSDRLPLGVLGAPMSRHWK